ncbi:UDP-N-acetylmuramoyl-L-alanyl-D-glutamate--2,6-diaminopimelate ligase [Radiobacillus deserti]|uniref:UDP-N-acetylmuramoyl-L-alanyl-D-glutamate--2, 6-diaminopimelate ligase n=1 Tax=Radiobacillus deserti TaxID=2594883 RepID=UPI001E4C2752|nr:UDP-N-acetylmuramoyl-L-alanyl-D-glutamate--2,6-diaminopimelate ligase [Radiobacillus deserti]
MILKELLSDISFYSTTTPIENVMIKGIEMDSRQIKPGYLFVCISGHTVDGHDYVKQAIQNGAIAILAEKPLDVDVPVITVSDTSRALAILANRYFERPTQDLHLIGVTGTNGKTSVTYLLEAIFQKAKKHTGLIGTIQMKIGEESFEVKNTTPDSLFLQKSFAKMLEKEVDAAFMEVSSHALVMGRTFGCDFDIAIFTNLTQDHLDYHSTMEEYLHAKSLLFSQLGNRYDGNPKYAIINKDDSHSLTLIKSTAQQVLTYGIHSDKLDVQATNVMLDANGSSFDMRTPVGTISIKSKLMGMFSVYNMLAAASAAICSGISLKAIQTALESTTGVRGRFEPVVAGQSFGVIVDYAHTPDSLENVLKTVKSFAKGNVYVVVGCGGDRDRTKRPIMAKTAVTYADLALFTSDNPRSEDPKQILKDMVEGVDGQTQAYRVIENRKEAIQYAVEHAKEDDIVVIAGKGHETYQIIGDTTYDFDDRQVATEIIHQILQKEL